MPKGMQLQARPAAQKTKIKQLEVLYFKAFCSNKKFFISVCPVGTDVS